MGKYIAIGVSIGFIVAIFLFATRAAHAQASIAEPDDLLIESVRAYSGAINTDDMLVVVQYRIDYDTLPSLAATDAFICRFFVDDVEVNNAEIIAFNNLGYGLGVCSMYFTDAQRQTAGIEFENPNAEDYEAVVQGKPSAFTDPPQVRTSSIVYRSSAQTGPSLTADVSNLAQSLENDADWVANEFDLITFTTGQQVLTFDGEAYFGLAIPNLQLMIPNLFGSSTVSPDVFERTFGNSEEQRLLGLWDSSPLNNSFNLIASGFGISKVWVLGLIGAIVIGAVVWFAKILTGDPEYGLLTIPFSYPLVTAVGLGSMTALFFTVAIGIIGLMFVLFLRRAA